MSSSDHLEKFPFVGCQIGTGKYVLLRLSYEGKTRLVVRQSIHSEFHKDVARPTMNFAQESVRLSVPFEKEKVYNQGFNCTNGSRFVNKLYIFLNTFLLFTFTLQIQRVDCKILGGGRLTFDPSNRKVHIYGYSVDYGRANHSLTKEIMLQSFPDYEVTWTNEGY